VGMILGTAAYMSPEQASGFPADRRADIWSFGAVLYEMLAGKKAFPGESISDTLATVLKLDPDWDGIPVETPLSIRKLVRRCLTKDRKQRLQAIGEARIALENPERDQPPPSTAPSRSRLGWVPWAATALFAIGMGVLAFVHFREKPPVAPVQRFEIAAPGGEIYPIAVVSPDGSRLVFSSGAQNTLWVRSLDSLEARPLPGTEGARGIPLWSPDSRHLAFVTADGKLKKIDASGGSAQVLCVTGQL
jgi:serine/threonine protein kinase